MRISNETQFRCEACGSPAPKWSGKCLTCGEWNTLHEEKTNLVSAKTQKIIPVSPLSLEDAFLKRIPSGFSECDRVLGGGIAHDALMLLSGDPGIGKSTLALHIGLHLSSHGNKVIYVSGEESVSQLTDRVKRVFEKIPESFFFINAQHLPSILQTLEKEKPQFVILDSIQTIRSDHVSGFSGTVSQLKGLAESFMIFAKTQHIPVLLIGHVNKEGDLAGPKVLEHLVDAVLYLEGDRYQDLRILRSMKNRFGPTSEIGVFSMTEKGFQEVKNTILAFLKERSKPETGSALTMTLEGSRPFLMEVQALTNPADYSFPKRTAVGIDLNRLQMLTAVLNKHAKLKLDHQDVYVSIAGGFSAKDPSIDLAIAAAIISSRKEKPLSVNSAFLGEISLSGEIRPANQQDRRVKELQNLGIQEIVGCFAKPPKTTVKLRNMEHIREL